MGKGGHIIHQEALINRKTCTIQSLEERFLHILSNCGINDNIIAVVYYNGVKAGINIQKISNTVKASVRTLGIEKQVILAHMVDTQSLRARGSMALNILGTSDTTIIKFGRWTRFKFLQIHEQTSHLRKRV